MKKIPSIILAALLQIMPVCRLAYTFCVLPSCDYAVISAWGLGAAALFGGVDAVSGQSVTINSPTTAKGTNGHPFSYRITTTETFGDMQYTATSVPTGLTAPNHSVSPVISGNPTAAGVFNTTLTVSAAGYPTITRPLTITIVPVGPPVITIQPTNQGVSPGQNASFTVQAPGAATYQWWFNTVKEPFATNSILTITNAQAANAGNYFVIASNSQGSVTSSVVTLTLGDSPVISSQPFSQVSDQGSNVTFTVAASASLAVYYQWYFNSATIPGATADSYTLPAVGGTNAGNYSVVVADYFGSVTSSVATLAIAGGVELNNNIPGSLVFPIYSAQTTNIYTGLYGNTATGIPRGSLVYSGTRLSAPVFTAQLWAALGTNQLESALTPVPDSIATFGTGTNVGFLIPVSPVPVIPGAVEGQTATLELRVWDNRAGTVTNWEQVRTNHSINRGTSALVNSQPLGGVAPPPPLTGMLSFNVHEIQGLSTPQKILARVQGGQILLSYPALVGQNYSVQYTDSPAPGINSWQTLTNIMAVSPTISFIDSPTNAAQRFYRLCWLSN